MHLFVCFSVIHVGLLQMQWVKIYIYIYILVYPYLNSANWNMSQNGIFFFRETHNATCYRMGHMCVTVCRWKAKTSDWGLYVVLCVKNTRYNWRPYRLHMNIAERGQNKQNILRAIWVSTWGIKKGSYFFPQGQIFSFLLDWANIFKGHLNPWS